VTGPAAGATRGSERGSGIAGDLAQDGKFVAQSRNDPASPTKRLSSGFLDSAGQGADVVKKSRDEAHRDDWAQTLSTTPLLDAPLESDGCVIRWFKNTDPDIAQPALEDHYVVLHLGGPKRVRRALGGPTLISDMAADAISVIPAGAAYDWSTEGPIEYAHVYIPPERLSRAAESIFDRDGGQVRLRSEVGQHDPLLATLFHTLIETAQSGRRDGLFLDVMTEAFLAQLLRGHGNLDEGVRRRQLALAPRRLSDVTDYVDLHLAEDITLDSLAAIGRLSRFHFTRAFARATGKTPHAFVMGRRLEQAKRMLRDTDLAISDIARACGFSGASHLSNRFVEAEGVRPGAFRQAR
jgi:AraC family transcriptional regulator